MAAAPRPDSATLANPENDERTKGWRSQAPEHFSPVRLQRKTSEASVRGTTLLGRRLA